MIRFIDRRNISDVLVAGSDLPLQGAVIPKFPPPMDGYGTIGIVLKEQAQRERFILIGNIHYFQYLGDGVLLQ